MPPEEDGQRVAAFRGRKENIGVDLETVNLLEAVRRGKRGLHLVEANGREESVEGED